MSLLCRYLIIEEALRSLAGRGADSIEDVIDTIKQCATWIQKPTSFEGLRRFMGTLSQPEKRDALHTMTEIARLAANAGAVITKSVPLLLANRAGSVTLSQEQCACLLAHAFFCTFEKERKNFNKFNFESIFDGSNRHSHVKLQFFLNYFSLIFKQMPDGCVSFRRVVLSQDSIPDWEKDETRLPLVAATSEGAIEDADGCLHVDFADPYIGGLVLTKGAVQEEIRFLICPEMVVSSLLCERMGPLEAIHIIGAQRYSSYSGYGKTLKWLPFEGYGSEPRDEFRRVICNVVAMDATHFKPRGTPAQYNRASIGRELNKKLPKEEKLGLLLGKMLALQAYAAFAAGKRELRPVATGNWGCGIFGGDKELKGLIQIIAAAKAGRPLIYYTFGDKKLEISINKQYEQLVREEATVGTIYKALLSYLKQREQNPQLSIFQHVAAFVNSSAGQ
ncbi:poly glycohydrolase [Ancylostoma caninum]|uniref:poly(ADP-ribose) glycohydrolase n=1 Tax=Ancylostoma caninum TaxID=29170 RepID=A0A368G422_ANCCA|nr:poly glycohydrolase [Ancylostoma caninum]